MISRENGTALLTGAQGLVGWNIYLALKRHFRVALFPSRRGRGPGEWVQERLKEYDGLPEIIGRLKPSLVVHAHAMCNLDVCEVQPEMTHLINVFATEKLLAALDPSRQRLVHLSTEHVFSGKKGAYREGDPVDPISVYGRSRVEAERLVLERFPGALVVRPGLAVGPSMQGDVGLHDFLKKRVSKGLVTSYFLDEIRSPMCAEDLAEGILFLIRKQAFGIYHLGGKEGISRYNLSVRLVREWGMNTDLIRPIKRKEDPLPRINDCSLDSSKAAREGWEVPEFRIFTKARHENHYV